MVFYKVIPKPRHQGQAILYYSRRERWHSGTNVLFVKKNLNCGYFDLKACMHVKITGSYISGRSA